jgi:hypothetical protein
MHEHMQSSHPEIRIEQQLHLSDNSAYLAIQCFICRQCFANKEQLLEHLRTHANVSRQFQVSIDEMLYILTKLHHRSIVVPSVVVCLKQEIHYRYTTIEYIDSK